MKLVIGCRYTPINKTTGATLEHSGVWTRAKSNNQNYLFLKEITDSYLKLTDDMKRGCDFFMKKDLIPYVPEKWAIKRTAENAEELNKYFNNKGCSLKYNDDVYLKHDLKFGDYVRSFLPDGYEEISYDEFLNIIEMDKKEDFVLPEKWCVKPTSETHDVIAKYYDIADRKTILNCYRQSCNKIYENYYFYSHNFGNKEPIIGNPEPGSNFTDKKKLFGFTEITFEQFTKYVVKKEEIMKKKLCFNGGSELMSWIRNYDKTAKSRISHAGSRENNFYFIPDESRFDQWLDQETIPEGYELAKDFEEFEQYLNTLTNTEMKKVIGYKFKPNQDSFIKAACALVNYQPFGTGTIYDVILYVGKHDDSLTILDNAEVLDIWFDKVYETDSLKAGDWVVVLPEDEYYSNCEKGIAQEIASINGDWFSLKFKSGATNSYEKVRKATPEEIEKAKQIIEDYKTLKIGSYSAEKIKGGVKFGCQDISNDILFSLKNLMSRPEFKFTCEVNNKEISLDFINKLLNLK